MEEDEEEQGGGEVGGHWELWLGTADWELWEERGDSVKSLLVEPRVLVQVVHYADAN